MINRFIKSNFITIIGVVFGLVVGYLYYRLVGCQSGSCSITSKPLNSSVYGAIMGGLLFSTFKKDNKK